MKRISIVIPIYNAEEYIEKCLEILTRQITEEDEIILVNDGSTDNSEEICKKYESDSDNIKCYTLENGGPSRARNYGIEKANGKYLIFLDIDDYIEDNYVERMLENIEKNDMVICGYNLVKVQKNQTVQIKMDKQKLTKENIMTLLENSIMLNTLWNKIYKIDIIKNNNIRFDEKEFRGEDTLFNLDYIKYAKQILIIEDILYNYIMKNNGLNLGYKESLQNKFKRTKKVSQKMMGIIDKKDEKQAKKIIKQMYKNNIIIYLKALLRNMKRSR